MIKKILKVSLLLILSTGCNTKENVSDLNFLLKAKEQIEEGIISYKEKQQNTYGPLIKSCNAVLNKLDKFGVEAVTCVPDPYVAGVGKLSNGKLSMVIYWLERETDVSAIRVYEFWPNGQEIMETYPLSIALMKYLKEDEKNTWVHVIAFQVTERTTPSILKNKKVWESYQAAKSMGMVNPPLFIAKPNSKVHVLISLIDEKNHESHVIPLECWTENPVNPYIKGGVGRGG